MAEIIINEHKNIYQALSVFQGELQPFDKKSQVDFTTKDGRRVNFKFTELGDIMKILYPLLGKHGLFVTWELGEKTDFVKTVECVVYHFVGGESIRSGKMEIKWKEDMKDNGGQITYARRYTLGLALGLSTEEDKDLELFDQSKKNLGSFAFGQVMATLKKLKADDLDKYIKFLTGELYVSETLEDGVMPAEGVEVEGLDGAKKKVKVPSLGLSAEQYGELLTFAEKRKAEIDGIDQTQNGKS